MCIKEDVVILRKLARKYLEIALNDHNSQRIVLHRAVNDLKMIRPVVLIDELPWGEMNIDNELTLLCEDKDFRQAEEYMRRTIYKFNHLRADMIVRPYLPVKKVIHTTGDGIFVEETTLQINQDTHIIAHEYNDQFADCEGLDKLHKEVITYDEVETNRKFFKLAEAIGDILPVKKVGIDNLGASPWDVISRYRGVTPLLMDLLVEPEFSHELMTKMTEIIMDKNEQYRILGLYDTDPNSLHCTTLLNSELHPETDNKDYKNIWGRGAAQIFASVSKEMHDEFDIEYMKNILGKCGLNYYGCCEPLDKKIDIVEKIPNLRKISITPWADVNIAAEAIGRKYVIASKPNPSSVSVGNLNTTELRKEITKIMDACYKNNCSFDMVLKDISTVAHRPENLFEWEKTVMDIAMNY
ncbi:MAG: hypothetical protein R3Y35_08110 [Clostridia bacterium]